MNFHIRRKTAIRVLSLSAAVHAVAIIKLLSQLDATMDQLVEQGNFLVNVVSRNPEILTDFDKIALSDLGLLKEKS